MNEYATLQYQKPLMHGPAVRRLQELCDSLGEDNGDNDGIYGTATASVVVALQRRFGLVEDGICGTKTWAAILSAVDEQTESSSSLGGSPEVYDRRGKHPPPKWYKTKRPWSKITGVTLHQTGCEMPSSPSGWDRLNAHLGITQEGLLIVVNDPRDWIWHAQGLSRNTIGIEIEGNYCGLEGNMRTLWKGGGGPHHLNPQMIKAIGKAFEWLTDQFARHKQEWKYVYGHRQSKDTRIADPGEEIWKTVALSWMTVLGAYDGGSECKFGSGRPIPNEWDPDRTAKYWSKT